MARRTIPFDLGINEAADRRVIPDGQFVLVRNARLARDGQLRTRAGYTAQAQTTYGTGTMTAYDLFSHNDRMCALGDRLSRGFPTDVFEFTRGLGAAAWRPTDPDSSAIRLPRATKLRDLGIPPDQEGGIETFDLAAGGGYVCVAYRSTTNALSYVHIFSADEDQTILFEALPQGDMFLPRVVALSDRFVIVGGNTANDQVEAWTFAWGTDESLQGGTLLFNEGSAIRGIDIVRVTGTTNFAVAVDQATANECLVRTFNSSLVQQVEFGPVTSAAFGPAVEADNSSNSLTLALSTGTAVQVYTYNLTTGAENGTGPHTTANLAGDSVPSVSIARFSSTQVAIACTEIPSSSATETKVLVAPFTTSTQTFGTVIEHEDLQLMGKIQVHSEEVVFPARTGRADELTPAGLYSSRIDSAKSLTPLAQKDLQTSAGVITNLSTYQLPNFALDIDNSKYYWPTPIKGTDDTSHPAVTELELGSTERRQVVQMGNSLYLAGGIPCVYDGRILCEMGYGERPRIISLAGSNGSGELISGATYRYRLLWTWFDSRRDEHLSSISEFEEVTLGATDDTVTAVCSVPHSLRNNLGSVETGSAIRLELYRTRATSTSTAPSITGTAQVSPPSISLDGLQIIIGTFDGVGFYQSHTVTFDSGSTDITAILADINAVISGEATATDDGGRVKLTLDTAGETFWIAILGGDADAQTALGLPQNTFDEGTTTFTTGGVFHFTADAFVPISDTPGAFVTITDLRDDDTDDDGLASQKLLYTALESPLENHAPPPFEYSSRVADRLVVAGTPKRELWVASKPVDFARPVNFAFFGLTRFQGRAEGDLEGVVRAGDNITLFSSRGLWEVRGSGPQRNGQGEFFPPSQLYTQGGLQDQGWRSLIQVDVGTFFQLDSDKIYLMSPGGALAWVGQQVRDTLETYPVITATAHMRGDQMVAFACQNTGGSDGVILLFDLRRQLWLVDDVGAVDALAEYQGRLAYIQSGVVYLQDTSAGSGTYVPMTVQLAPYKGKNPVGDGALTAVVLLGSYRGDCNIELQISYNDGRTWTTLGNYDLESSEYSVGDPVELLFQPAGDESRRFMLQVLMTHDSANSAGVWLNALDLEHDDDSGPARLANAHMR